MIEDDAVCPPKLFSDDIAGVSSNTNTLHDFSFEQTSIKDVSDFLELEKCLSWVQSNNFKRVALQFPDNYLRYSYDVVKFLEKSSAKVYILGDTSYGSCCVDFITAEHANCDSLIHFGDACMTAAVPNFPILYIFGRYRLNLENLQRELALNVLKEKGYTRNVGILYDSEFSNECDKMLSIVSTFFDSTEMFRLNFRKQNNGSSEVTSKAGKCRVLLGRVVSERIFSDEWINATLVFIGAESSPLLSIWLMSFVQFSSVLHYVPKKEKIEVISPSTARVLRKRLYLVEKLRDASSVGLVIGTLAVHGFREAITRVRELCRRVGKRLYVFSIGKINEAKLSNFADFVDVFILLSCPFGIILNTGDFYKPIVSLYEAEIALNPSKDWFTSRGWTSEFGEFTQDPIGEEAEETTDVSLITGRIRSTHLSDNFTKNEKGMQIMQYSAGDYFANRSWKGLDDENLEQEDGCVLRVGLDGIAVSYTSESR